MKQLLPFILLLLAVGLNAQPQANFSADMTSACSGESITFTDNSTGAIVSWLWDFGNGVTSTEQNPQVIYELTDNFPGDNYTVSLTVTDDAGITNTLSRTNYVSILNLNADFSLAPQNGYEIPFVVFFTDQSINPDTWFWDFGDGNTSTLQNPVHIYNLFGDFTVTLTIADTIIGCTQMTQDFVTVSSVNADFTTGDEFGAFGCAPLSVDFTNLTTFTDDEINYQWDFGDGDTSIEANPTHVYDEPGLYTVSLMSTDGNGSMDSEVKNAYVQAIGPNVNFEADTLSGFEGLEVTFTDMTSFGAPITSWTWNFGDGNTSNLQNPVHTYSTAGIYDVSLTITDIDGCFRTFARPAYINVEVMPAAVPTVGTWGVIICFLSFFVIFISAVKNSKVLLNMN